MAGIPALPAKRVVLRSSSGGSQDALATGFAEPDVVSNQKEGDRKMAVAVPTYPVRVEGKLDPNLSRWLWLVKWLLAIPHYVVLTFLWIAFVVLSVIAFFAILFTGRYPRGMFEFNVGVLRWTWRVGFYAFAANGTDRYPPFSLARTDYPATFEVEYPQKLSRGLVLVKWWLLAIPHYFVLAFFIGAGGWLAWKAGGGLVFLLVFFAVVALLFTGRYPQSIFDFVLGMNRWVLRVAAYAGLMTDRYPPFRLDMGEADAAGLGVPPADRTPAAPAALRREWGAGRIFLVVTGSFAALLAVLLLIGGGTVVTIDQTQRDRDNFVMSPTEGYSTSTYAVVSESHDIKVEGPDFVASDFLGTLRLRSESDEAVFIGIGPTAAVDRYLSGVRHEEVRDLGVDRADYRLESGGATPPGAQTFWAESAEGSGAQTLSWEIEDGSWSVVLMRSDGSSGVEADLSVGARLPHLVWVGVGLLAFGAILLAVGAVLIYFAVRRAGEANA
jgi:hypothetical protein